MKRILAPSLLLILVHVSGAAGLVLVDKGQAKATIVVGSAASPQARQAAEELQTYLRRISGATLAVVENPAAAKGLKIMVGHSAASAAAAGLKLRIPSGRTSQFAEEGYVVASGPDAVILAGNETPPYDGTFFAVSDFLESLGCRWYFPGAFGELVPKSATIEVKPVSRLIRPELRVRDIWYSGHLACTAEQGQEFQTWKRRNRMTLGFWVAMGPYLQNPTDDSTWRLLPKDHYWKSHPEYYALNPDGSRNERFICMSNPGAIQAAVNTITEYFRQNPDNYSFAFSPPDAPVLCHCKACTDRLNGGFGGEGRGEVSDPYFQFVFQVADAVAKKYPDRWIISMAYYNRCRPPEGVDGRHKNVLIQLASIQQCNLHSYLDAKCPSRQQFAAMLARWGQLAGGCVFYEYDPHDWSHSQRPFWGSQRIAQDLRTLKEQGGWGFSDEGQMAWLSTGLNYYVRAKLAWGLAQDPAGLERDFFRQFFGPAAEPMAKYYTTVEQALQATNLHVAANYDFLAVLPRPILDECRACLDEAAAKASDEPYKGRVAAFRGHFDRIDAWEKARAAMARADYRTATQAAQAMIQAVERVNHPMLLQDQGPYGGEMSGASIADCVRQLDEWTRGSKGQLLAVLPATASFRTDPAGQGVLYRWYRNEADAKGWREIALTTGWYNQGITAGSGQRYSGVAWYRTKVTLPKVPEGPVALRLPELKGSEVWLWCNGWFAGYGQKTETGGLPGDLKHPLTVEVTGLLKPGDNALVFRIRGDGGISLPPLLFQPLRPAHPNPSVNANTENNRMSKSLPLDDRNLCCEGFVQTQRSSSRASFDRGLSDYPFTVDSPCGRVRFKTDATAVRLEIEYADQAALTGHHVYSSIGLCRIDGTITASFNRTGNKGGRQAIDLRAGPGAGPHEYEVILPIADKVDICGLSIESRARFFPVAAEPPTRYVAHGDSITQGFWASDPIHTYAWQLAQAKRWSLVNHGFGGRTAVADDGRRVGQLNPDIVTILLGVNDCLHQVPLADFRSNYQGIIVNLRKFKPTVPVYAITPLNVPGTWPGTEKLETYRAVVRDIVARSRDPNLHVIEGPDLIPDEIRYVQDGLHPNDEGFTLMAKQLAQRIHSL